MSGCCEPRAAVADRGDAAGLSVKPCKTRIFICPRSFTPESLRGQWEEAYSRERRTSAVRFLPLDSLLGQLGNPGPNRENDDLVSTKSSSSGVQLSSSRWASTSANKSETVFEYVPVL